MKEIYIRNNPTFNRATIERLKQSEVMAEQSELLTGPWFMAKSKTPVIKPKGNQMSNDLKEQNKCALLFDKVDTHFCQLKRSTAHYLGEKLNLTNDKMSYNERADIQEELIEKCDNLHMTHSWKLSIIVKKRLAELVCMENDAEVATVEYLIQEGVPTLTTTLGIKTNFQYQFIINCWEPNQQCRHQRKTRETGMCMQCTYTAYHMIPQINYNFLAKLILGKPEPDWQKQDDEGYNKMMKVTKRHQESTYDVREFVLDNFRQGDKL